MCLWMADCDHHGDGLTGEMSFLRGLGNGVTSLLGMLCMEELNKMIETQADRQTNRERQRELHHDCYDCVPGTLHVGDEIREINGISVHGQTVEVLQKMLVRNSDFLILL